MTRKNLVLSTILVLMALVLVACGGGGDKKSQPDTGTNYNPSYQLPEDHHACQQNPSDDRCQSGIEDFVDDLPARIEESIQDAMQDAANTADTAEDYADEAVCGDGYWIKCDTGD